MSSEDKGHKLTGQQQRVLKLLFKFRFVPTWLLADVMGIRRASVYEVIEYLVAKELVIKVYDRSYRMDRKPAYYYLSKAGVTAVRKVMDVKESVVHALYKNDQAPDDFIVHCMRLAHCYVAIMKQLPDGSDIFSKTEINRFSQFPKNRPDLYIRTPEGKEAIIVLAYDMPQYIARKRLDEIIRHSEDEGWTSDSYPVIGFILKDQSTKNSFLYTTHKKLEDMGMDEDELPILVTCLKELNEPTASTWSTPYRLKQNIPLFDVAETTSG